MHRNDYIAVAAGIVVIGILFFGISQFSTLLGGAPSAIAPVATAATTTDTTDTSTTANQPTIAMNTLPDGLQIGDEVIGTGTPATAGSTVTVNYIGKLEDGTVFDSSASHGQPFSFVLGKGNVIQGWDEGLLGMKVGGTRVLVIPPALGYGAQVMGPIPANSTLLFEVQLVSVSN